jgi:hypothetical protein
MWASCDCKKLAPVSVDKIGAELLPQKLLPQKNLPELPRFGVYTLAGNINT